MMFSRTIMRLASRTGRTKFIAKVMAFIWLFSLGVSMVNACVLWESRAGAPSQARVGWLQSSPSARHTVADAPVAGLAAAHDSEQPGSGAQACKSFCDSEQTTIPKTNALDLSDTPPLAVATGMWWPRSAPQTDAAWRIAAAAPPPRLAPAILFLRLTL